MRILFYSSYFHPYISGLTQSPQRFLSNLSKSHAISVLTFPHQKKLDNSERWNGMSIIRMPYLFKISKGYISPQSFLFFLKELRKNDIIFLNLPNVEGLTLAIFAKLFGKIIISLYNCQVDLGGNILQKLITGILNISVFLQLFLSDVIVTYPDYLEHQRIGKIFKKKIHITLPIISKHDIDKKIFEDYKQLKKSDIWIGFAGRIAQEKGIEYLIRALSHPELARPSEPGRSGVSGSHPVKLIFAGPPPSEVVGEQKYFDHIKKLLDDKNISYIFLGKLSDSGLASFYKSLDLLVLPSVNNTEAFGMVQAEAMLHGTPVVASNLLGVRIPIQQTKMGILVRPKDVNQLAGAIAEILKNQNRFSNAHLVKKAGQVFDSKKIYKFYEDLIGN